MQPTTLPFGQKNSGTEAQGPYRAAASGMQRGRHGNYVDDWIGYSNDLEQLLSDFTMFLEVCYVLSIPSRLESPKLVSDIQRLSSLDSE